MLKGAFVGTLAGLLVVGAAQAQPVVYTWTGYGKNVPGSSKCPTYKMVIDVTVDGDSVKALGISPNKWIKIVIDGSDKPGWVSYAEGFMSCTPTVDLFPVVTK